MATTVNINVAVAPNGNSIKDGVGFTFAAGSGTPSGVVFADGKLDFSKQYASGTELTLAFQLTTPTLKFSTGPNIGTFPLSFFGAQNGAKDACWIALYGQKPGIYNGTEFVFPSNALGPGYASLTIIDKNGDGNTYEYALWVWTALDGSSGQSFEDDPKLINHPNNK